ncbi:MAG: SUMF1/EgtB/PvdO family nonheme iron enzyme [Anaerolineae bacterium]|nr:SUMF1/EgtB/PvdO family nonheme iron enzyme [Anaerolineae bacterium]
MEYLDFELEINPGSGRMYPVVARSPGGEARATMYFPFSELELQNQLLTLENALLRSGGTLRRVLSPELQAVRDFGRELFDALLSSEIRGRYEVSHEKTVQQGKGLRFKLRINTPHLAALPWEFLYDSRRAEYVCLSQETPVVRYLELPSPIQPLPITPPLRILGMVVSPSGLAALKVDLEKQRVEEALRELRAAGLVELTWLEGQTWRDLHRAIRREAWHIFHFIGHGGFDRARDTGFLALADERGQVWRLGAVELGRLLANHRALRLALLNACEGAHGSEQDIYASTTATLVQRGIPAVVAMQYAITDRAAIEFARTFYEAVADGLPVDAALVEARVAVSLAVTNTVEWGTPVLYMRAPDGMLFEMGPPASPAVVSPPPPVTPKPMPATPAVSPSTATRQTVATPARQPFEPELVFIPAGEFLMGSDPQRDKQARGNEQSQHTVYLPDYYIAKTPVTNAQYLAFVQATGHTAPSHWKNGQIPDGKDNHPVVDVTWYDAVAYCEWLAKETSKLYRLPTEAQWEKAARGTDGRIYPWGDRFDKDRCNTRDSGIGGTTPVGKYSPDGDSSYGCVDMAGNVWEWTSSLWGKDLYNPDFKYPYQADDGRENMTAEGNVRRVLRGGAFHFSGFAARCAYRLSLRPVHHLNHFGFRVVMGASPFS